MIQCIILDGFHQGEVLRLPQARPEIKIPAPKRITTCDCNLDDIVSFESDANIEVYKVAFRSIDGKVALYSKDGSPDAIFRRDWIVKPLRATKPLYFNCRDDQAWE